MANYNYRIVNVFAESVLAGNPLCVFEDARGTMARRSYVVACADLFGAAILPDLVDRLARGADADATLEVRLVLCEDTFNESNVSHASACVWSVILGWVDAFGTIKPAMHFCIAFKDNVSASLSYIFILSSKVGNGSPFCFGRKSHFS